MIQYPGGTALDRASEGYSLSRNFLSDLGMTVAYGGQPNALGALLFFLSVIVLVLGAGGCLPEYVRLYSEPPRSRRLAWAAGAGGVIVCAAFIGVALTPENGFMSLHVRFTLLAFRVFPVMALLLTVASLYSSVLPRRVAVAWAALAAVLVGFVGVLEWGPALTTSNGLTIHVVAQKIAAIATAGIFVYLSVEADRVLATSSTARS
jgi:hypothetical protein